MFYEHLGPKYQHEHDVRYILEDIAAQLAEDIKDLKKVDSSEEDVIIALQIAIDICKASAEEHRMNEIYLAGQYESGEAV